jgi:glycosyltransferase involved in cell wall biosynthesis
LALESGLSVAEIEALRTSERAALTAAHHVIATSATTARILIADYDVPADRVTVARPGTDPVPAAHGSHNDTIQMLAVGAVVPRKGYDVLVAALATLADLPWRLTIAGDCERDTVTAAWIQSEIARCHLAEQITVVGAVTPERLAELYRTADLFVLASRFEGYGMAFTEAIAYGLPVVGTTAGAIPETVSSEAAVLIASDDSTALADALRRLIMHESERHRLALAARTAAAHLPTWRDSAALFAGAIKAVA